MRIAWKLALRLGVVLLGLGVLIGLLVPAWGNGIVVWTAIYAVAPWGLLSSSLLPFSSHTEPWGSLRKRD